MLGRAFAVVYLVLAWTMIPRLWQWDGELSTSAALHSAAGIAVGIALVSKVAILRLFPAFRGSIPTFGFVVMAGTLLAAGLAMPPAAREAWLARQSTTPAALERVAASWPALASRFGAAVPDRDDLRDGHRQLHTACHQCHGIGRMIRQRRDAADWGRVLGRMQQYSEGRETIGDEAVRDIAGYLLAIRGSDLGAPAPLETPTPASSSAGRTPAEPDVTDSPTPPPIETSMEASVEPSGDAQPEPPPTPSSAARTNSPWTRVRGLFEERCVVCHGGPRPSAGLRLETHHDVLVGSVNGPVVVPGDSGRSELVARLRGERRPRMPLDGPPYLGEDEIAAVADWIDGGAAGADAEAGLVNNANPIDRGEQPRHAPNGQAGEARSPTPRAPDTGPVTFARIRPILLRGCARCHTRDGLRGPPPEGLILTSYEAVVAGGERLVVVPGSPDASMLVRHVEGRERPRMPFDGPPWLTPEEIADLRRWIADGARDEQGSPATIAAGREIRLNGTLTRRWALDGVPFVLSPGARTRDATVGRRVEVRATIGPDGVLVATRVRGR